MKRIILYLVLISMAFASCKKIIEVDSVNAEPQLVIEGNLIDRFMLQQIRISKSVGYTETNVFPKISGATVTVSDDRGGTFKFAESAPGVYAFGMRAIPGVTYTMQVKVGDKSYTASSKMPLAVKLDSIGVITNSFFGREQKTAAAFFTDPATSANYYHFNLYVNGLMSDRIYVVNDRLTNGNHLRYQLFYERGDDDGLKSGDLIAVEMECIDLNIFNYWYALSQQSGRGPNQGTTPSNPISNISGGALGYFSAHTLQRLSNKVP